MTPVELRDGQERRLPLGPGDPDAQGLVHLSRAFQAQNSRRRLAEQAADRRFRQATTAAILANAEPEELPRLVPDPSPGEGGFAARSTPLPDVHPQVGSLTYPNTKAVHIQFQSLGERVQARRGVPPDAGGDPTLLSRRELADYRRHSSRALLETIREMEGMDDDQHRRIVRSLGLRQRRRRSEPRDYDATLRKLDRHFEANDGDAPSMDRLHANRERWGRTAPNPTLGQLRSLDGGRLTRERLEAFDRQAGAAGRRRRRPMDDDGSESDVDSDDTVSVDSDEPEDLLDPDAPADEQWGLMNNYRIAAALSAKHFEVRRALDSIERMAQESGQGESYPAGRRLRGTRRLPPGGGMPAQAGGGMRERRVADDGNCLFRAVSVAHSGSEDGHVALRGRVASEMRDDPELAHAVHGRRDDNRLRDMHLTSGPVVWGGDPEIMYLSHLLGRPIHVHDPGGGAPFVFRGLHLFGHPAPTGAPLHIVRRGAHFNALR